MTETTETTKSSKLDKFKTVVGLVVGISVSGTIVTIIHQNTQTFTTPQKVKLYIGAATVGSMVAKAAQKHISDEIDEVVEIFTDVKSSLEDDDVSNVTDLH